MSGGSIHPSFHGDNSYQPEANSSPGCFLEDLLANHRIRCYPTSLEEELSIIRNISTLGLNFDEATQYHTAKKFNATIVI